MRALAHCTVTPTTDAELIRAVMLSLGDEILFDEYPEVPRADAALTSPAFLCLKVEDPGGIQGVVLCVDYELHTLFLPSLRGARALNAGREVLRWLWENTDAPVLRSYFYSHQPHVRLFARLVGFTPVACDQPPLHIKGRPVYRTNLILNRPL